MRRLCGSIATESPWKAYRARMMSHQPQKCDLISLNSVTRGALRGLSRGHRGRDRIQRRAGLRAIGAPSLRHVGPPAATLAAERLGGDAHQIDCVEARSEVRRDAD